MFSRVRGCVLHITLYRPPHTYNSRCLIKVKLQVGRAREAGASYLFQIFRKILLSYFWKDKQERLEDRISFSHNAEIFFMYAFYIQNLFKVPYVIQKNVSKHLNNFPHLESHQSSPHFDIYICIYYKLVFESLLKHKTE